MDDVVVVINQVGPLPFSVTFKSPAVGPVSFFLSASAWTGTANTWLAVTLEMDGVSIGGAKIFANNASTHMALVPVFIAAKLSVGAHTLTLKPGNSTTVSDFNDFFHVALHL